MTIKSCSVPVIALMIAATSASAQRADAGRVAFAARVAAHAQLHREIAREIFVDAPFADFESGFAAVAHFRDALRAARPEAHEGDIFAPIALAVRRTLWSALCDAGIEPRGVIADMVEDTEPGARPLVVNEAFPWERGNVMPPSLIAALPPLPVEFEYRLVGPNLVLIDVKAGLVVDILRDALVDTTTAD
jgi:hypothetical protein